MTKSRLMTIGLAVAAAAIVLPRIMKYANDPKNKDSLIAKIVTP